MISYSINPHALGDQAFDEINTKVVSLTLKDESGNALSISNLPSAISLTVPLKDTGNKTPQVQEYSVPEVMMYRTFTENRGNSLVKLSLKLERSALFEVYVKYGSRPSKQDYDYFTTIEGAPCQNANLSCNESTYVWFDAARKGKYSIGLLQKWNARERRTAAWKIDYSDNDLQRKVPKKRMARSLLQLNNPEGKLCVKYKDPPTPQPLVNVTVMPPYNPETSVNFTLEVDSAGCLYWSETKEQWISEGCKVRTIHTIINKFAKQD